MLRCHFPAFSPPADGQLRTQYPHPAKNKISNKSDAIKGIKHPRASSPLTPSWRENNSNKEPEYH